LAGAPLFRQRPHEPMNAFLTRKLLAPPPILDDRLPAILTGPLTRALDPEPTRRPSVDEFRQQLATAVRSSSLPAPPRPPPLRRLRSAKRTVPDALPASTTTRLPHWPTSAGSYTGPGRAQRHRAPLLISALFTVLVVIALVVTALTVADADDQDASTTSLITPTPTLSSNSAATPSPSPTFPPTTPLPPATSAAPTGAASAGVSALSTTVTTTPPPTTAASTTSTSSPPAHSASTVDLAEPTAAAIVTAAQADSFVRSYYEAVEVGDYERSWSQLSPEFQRGKARSFDYYAEFWDDNDIDVGDVVLVDADRERAIVDVELRWNGSSDAVTDRFELRPGGGGQLLISGQEPMIR
jgi:hypothetical protein